MGLIWREGTIPINPPRPSPAGTSTYLTDGKPPVWSHHRSAMLHCALSKGYRGVNQAKSQLNHALGEKPKALS